MLDETEHDIVRPEYAHADAGPHEQAIRPAPARWGGVRRTIFNDADADADADAGVADRARPRIPARGGYRVARTDHRDALAAESMAIA